MSKGRSGDLRVRIRHREYVLDVVGSGVVSFTVSSFLAINPGLQTLFPWLSNLANNFEAYLFRALSFQYRTDSSSATVGKLMMAVDYDAADPAPSSKQQMLQQRTKCDCALWQMVDMDCDPADLSKLPQRYVRNGVVASTDVKTYDVGVLSIAQSSVGATTVIGELFVEYDVELITPTPPPAPVSLKIAGGGVVSKTALFGTAPVKTGTADISVNSTGTTLTFNQAGQYLLELDKVGTALVATTLTGTATHSALGAFETPAAALESLESFSINVLLAGQTIIFNASGDGTDTGSTARIALYAAANA